MKLSLDFLKRAPKEPSVNELLNDYSRQMKEPMRRMILQSDLLWEQFQVTKDMKTEKIPVPQADLEKIVDLMESLALAAENIKAVPQPEKLKGNLDFEELALATRQCTRSGVTERISSIISWHPELKDIIVARKEKAQTGAQQALDTWTNDGCPADKDISVMPIRLKAPTA